ATIHLHALTSAANTGTLTNTATISANNENAADTGDNTASATVTIKAPDVKVVKAADAAVINAGDTAGFTVTVSNHGLGTAYGVSFSDTLPGGVSWVLDSGDPRFALSGSALSFSGATLAAGDSAT